MAELEVIRLRVLVLRRGSLRVFRLNTVSPSLRWIRTHLTWLQDLHLQASVQKICKPRRNKKGDSGE